MDDYQLDLICSSNPDCGCDCMHCPYFIAHMREELGLDENDPAALEDCAYDD